MPDAVTYRATGKRKTSVARVTLTPGVGTVVINGRAIDEYFGRKVLETIAQMPFETTHTGGKFDVKAPAMSGHDIFERHFRVQMNTLEQLVIFLPALWLFALHWNNVVAAALGVVWLIGRVLYMTSYVADPSKRGPGFLIGGIASLILLIGGAVGAVMSIAATGAL